MSEEKRRHDDGLLAKLVKLWPLIVVIGGVIMTYTKLGSTVEGNSKTLDKEVPAIRALERRMDVNDERWSVVRDELKSINRKLDRRDR